MNTHEYYARLRREHPTMPARHALSRARHEAAIDELDGRIDWTPTGAYGGGPGIYVGELEDSLGAQLVIYADEEPYDWGDIEPSDYERENLEVIGVALRIGGEELDALWGIGYVPRMRDWPYATCFREALSTALQCGWIEMAQREPHERAEWEARGVRTVSR